MAKKTRIDRRGKIRSIVTRWNFPNNKPHWSITKRASVWRRRRIIDDVRASDSVTLSDAIEAHLNRPVASSVVLTDAVAINGEKIILNSVTFADTGGIVKNFESPANASSVSLSDSIGFDLGTLSRVFNTSKFTDTLFNAIGADQEFYTDSVTASDSVSLDVSKPLSETASVSDSIGFAFDTSGVFNTNVINLSQFNG